MIFVAAMMLLGMNAVNAQVYKLPCVVHVVYKNAADDMSDVQVRRIIDSVNLNLRGLSANNKISRQIFDTLKADTEIELCLATKDSAGNATTGILHVQTTITPLAGDFNFPRLFSQGWDDTRYINIWIFPLGAGVPGMGGFTFNNNNTIFLPTHPYGVSVNKTLSNVQQHLISLLTHELGHYFGLSHTFDTDDGVDDTPCSTDNTVGPLSCDPAFQNINTCSAEAPFWGNTNPPDMVENFMSYYVDCQKMFTKGQKAKMRAYINTNLTSLLNAGSAICGQVNSVQTLPGVSAVAAYPNPAGNQFTVTGFSGEISVQLMNNLGQEVLPMRKIHADVPVDIRHLSPGVYFIRVFSGGETAILRLFKNQ